MKTDIYYFSGTGNSLAVAKKLAENLEHASVISIAGAVKKKETVSAEVLGIVCPIYMYNVPYIVVDFITQIERADYCFLVFAGGGEPGGALRAARNLFASHELSLNGLFNIRMPSNYTPYGAPPEELQKRLFEAAAEKVTEIAALVRGRTDHADKDETGFLKTHIHPGLLYKLGYKHIKRMDRSFLVDDTCNSCSVCEQVCPVDNIVMKEGKPEWQHQCQQCYACLQWCPQEAIQYGKRTEGIKRYHHPDVSLKDIIRSS